MNQEILLEKYFFEGADYDDEPKVYGVCDECNTDILEGEVALVFDGWLCCEDCFSDHKREVYLDEL